MAIERRHFFQVTAAAVALGCVPFRRLVAPVLKTRYAAVFRKRGYPGPVVALKESSIKKQGPWAG